MHQEISKDDYKRIYQKIAPSEDLHHRVLAAQVPSAHTQRKYPYAAAIAALIVFIGAGTAYACTHPALIREFFGDSVREQIPEKLYAEIGESFSCDGYTYTVEGNLYNETLQKGYLALRINREDGSAPTVEWTGYGISDEQDTSIHGSGILIDHRTVSAIVFNSSCGISGKYAQEEDGTYLYFVYNYEEKSSSQKEPAISIASKEDLKHPSDLSWIPLTSKDMETVTKDCGNGISIVLGNLDSYVTWNEKEEHLDSIVIIDSDGIRHPVWENGSPVSNPRQWAGSTLFEDADGNCSLDARLDEPIALDHVRIEVNGVEY